MFEPESPVQEAVVTITAQDIIAAPSCQAVVRRPPLSNH
jgi:hypothetical protein